MEQLLAMNVAAILTQAACGSSGGSNAVSPDLSPHSDKAGGEGDLIFREKLVPLFEKCFHLSSSHLGFRTPILCINRNQSGNCVQPETEFRQRTMSEF
jgi:hypothetical protein